MYTSVLVSSALVVLMVESSLQEAFPEAPRVTRAYSGGGGSEFGGSQGYGGSQGFGGNQGFNGAQGFGGSRGGFGGQGGDSRYGFNIVDTPDRYGYEANYPGGRASFFLLGPNRGPGQQGNRGGIGQGGFQQGGYQQGGYQPGGNQQGGYQQGWGSQKAGGYQQAGRGW